MLFIRIIKNPRYYCILLYKKVVNFCRSYYYSGNKVYCEICEWKGKLFFKGQCPKCNSLPRTRLLPYSLKYFNIKKNAFNILNIGPNKHEYDYIRTNIIDLMNYDRIDILAYAHINILQDITKSNLTDQTYDLVIAWHVLEHIPNDLKAISEVHRLLKSGGHFLVSVPIYPIKNLKTFEDVNIAYEDFEKIHGHYDHCRSCGLDYFKRFEEIGFKTSTLLVESLNQKDSDFYGLREDHVVWCFNK